MSFVTVKLLEFMEFSKAIQIKSWINRFNANRNHNGFASIRFECSMFSIGHWSIDLSLSEKGVFFMEEMEVLNTLYAGGGFRFFIGSRNDSPIIYLQ